MMKINLVPLFLVFSVFLLGASTCSVSNNQEPCTTKGTVRDFRSLDGCEFLIEGEDGQFYQPLLIWTNGEEIPAMGDWPEDPFEGFKMVDGQAITFSFEERMVASICMKGKGVVITCIN